ncbi:hypothetical protein CWI36_0162p0020 [Hamiltosporidium magnivora]|uniref:Uncharacterized protein n=1 Tax=Hamiltosporidium magnivora TaxID=148818 RepID=A0A4Q9LIV5_9MICR|nr:hypothetical protein CWI36_0478p0010 [Hamiltosporidium magnivora]TBU08064.1 hypothetical protein CWI36_0187p0020 [Hamiltosporidium magnivora]TBU08260.1 hypothetical protein CWI36_0162p0020 [Hamiltosporidium magnivora]
MKMRKSSSLVFAMAIIFSYIKASSASESFEAEYKKDFEAFKYKNQLRALKESQLACFTWGGYVNYFSFFIIDPKQDKSVIDNFLKVGKTTIKDYVSQSDHPKKLIYITHLKFEKFSSFKNHLASLLEQNQTSKIRNNLKILEQIADCIAINLKQEFIHNSIYHIFINIKKEKRVILYGYHIFFHHCTRNMVKIKDFLFDIDKNDKFKAYNYIAFMIIKICEGGRFEQESEIED